MLGSYAGDVEVTVSLMAAIVLSVFYSSGSFMEQGTVASEVAARSEYVAEIQQA